jgi:hypothetical protein
MIFVRTVALLTASWLEFRVDGPFLVHGVTS